MVLVGSIAVSAVAAGPARAANTGTIPGSPLTVYANDLGQLQVAFNGVASGEFYTGALAPNKGGLTAAVAVGASSTTFTNFGLRGNLPFTAVSGPTLGGDGSAGNPWTLTTTFAAQTQAGGPLLNVNEVVSYVNGTTQVGVQYAVTNVEALGQPLTVRLYETADVLPAGTYNASGFLVGAAPTRRLGAQGLFNTVGGSDSLLELDPWDRFQESRASDLDNAIASSTATSSVGLNNAYVGTVVSNGAAVGAQWNLGVMGPGPAVVTRKVAWGFSRTSALSLGAASASQATGLSQTVTVAARTNDGAPDVGRSVPYTITGANPSSGAVITGAGGVAAITWTGLKTGTDTLTAFADRDGNGAWDVNNEPRQITTVTWTQGAPPPPPPPPVPGKSVVVKVVSGQVFIKKPGGSRATGPAKGFVPLTGAANVPMGSQLDTSKGRVALTSAADTAGKKTQTSDFYDGIFQVKQAVPKKKPKKAKALTTDLILKGEISRSQCAPLKGARAAAVSAKKKKKGPKSVLGKLWGNGKGKFRSNGTYSSATVRGTVWLTQDECDGTLTKVRRGTVSVRDFKRKKTITVKAGHSYLARAKRAAAKSHH